MTADDVLSQGIHYESDVCQDHSPIRNPKVLQKSEKVEMSDDEDLKGWFYTQIPVQAQRDVYADQFTTFSSSDPIREGIEQKHISFVSQEHSTVDKTDSTKKEAKKKKIKTTKSMKANAVFGALVGFAERHPNVLELILISPLLIMVCYILFVEGGQLYSFN